MEFVKIDDKDIEINRLKQKVENLENRMDFLDKNWIYWTKDTRELGQRLMLALGKLSE